MERTPDAGMPAFRGRRSRRRRPADGRPQWSPDRTGSLGCHGVHAGERASGHAATCGSGQNAGVAPMSRSEDTKHTQPGPRAPVRVPFLDLEAQYRAIREDIDAAIAETIRASRFIIGSEETKFERAFADSLRVPHAVGCSCGTSALYLALVALGVPRGAEVIVPTLTYIATAEAGSLAGAIPVFVDSEPDTGLIDLGA